MDEAVSGMGEGVMKDIYTLDEVRAVARGSYARGYCGVYEEDPLSEGFDYDDTEQVDALIEQFIDTEETR